MPLDLVPHSLSFFAKARYSSSVNTLFSSQQRNVLNGWWYTQIRLPYAQAQARIFGGDITTASIEGHGTDRHLYIPRHALVKVVL